MSTKIQVCGSSPGMMRVSVEGTDLSTEISTALPAYTAVQELAAFMEVLFLAVPETPKKSIAPRGEK